MPGSPSSSLKALPDNLQSLVDEIGRKQVFLHLLQLTRGTDWNVFQALGEPGFDALLLHAKSGKQVRLGVRTRLGYELDTGTIRAVGLSLTEEEYQVCDYLVGCLLEPNEFFVFAKEDLEKGQEYGKVVWGRVVMVNEEGELLPEFIPYRGAWQLLLRSVPWNSPANPQAAPAPAPKAEPAREEKPRTGSEWPELDQAVVQREMERLEELKRIEAQEFIEKMEADTEKLFQVQGIKAGLGENLDKVMALVREWDPPVSALVEKMADAAKLSTIWTLKVKIVAAPHNRSHALLWEVYFGNWMGILGWYNVELELDPDGDPLRFRVECKEPGHWIEAEPTLEALKALLVEAFRLGNVHEPGRQERQGWLLRQKQGKRN